jgi:hypothetical protein
VSFAFYLLAYRPFLGFFGALVLWSLDADLCSCTHRKNLTAWHAGDALVQGIAAVNNNTIVVVHSVGPLILEPWIDHPNVTAVRLPGFHTLLLITLFYHSPTNHSSILFRFSGPASLAPKSAMPFATSSMATGILQADLLIR